GVWSVTGVETCALPMCSGELTTALLGGQVQFACSAPDFKCGRSAPRLLQANCTWPPSSAVVSSPEPLYAMPAAASLGSPRSENIYCGPKFCSVPAPTLAKLSLPGCFAISSVSSFIVLQGASVLSAED